MSKAKSVKEAKPAMPRIIPEPKFNNHWDEARRLYLEECEKEFHIHMCREAIKQRKEEEQWKAEMERRHAIEVAILEGHNPPLIDVAEVVRAGAEEIPARLLMDKNGGMWTSNKDFGSIKRVTLKEAMDWYRIANKYDGMGTRPDTIVRFLKMVVKALPEN